MEFLTIVKNNKTYNINFDNVAYTTISKDEKDSCYFAIYFVRRGLNLEFNENEVSSIKIKKANPSDKNKLYPLQKEYELEEVCLEPKNFKPQACMINLKHKLTKQKIFYIDQNGPIAQAGTNAQGFFVDQIGGVYTVRQHRNKGFSTKLMGNIVKTLLKRKNKIVLFVKKQNYSAKRVYEKLNFKPLGDFKIIYF